MDEDVSHAWGRNLSELTAIVCTEISHHMFGDDCATIIQSMTNPLELTPEKLKTQSGLSDHQFNIAYGTLVQHHVIIESDCLLLNPGAIFERLYYMHYREFAESFARIPQEVPIIDLIIQTVFREFLPTSKIVSLILLNEPEQDRDILVEVLEHLMRSNVLIVIEDILAFNVSFFINQMRFKAILNLVKYQDPSVSQFVKYIFSHDLYQESLTSTEAIPFNKGQLEFQASQVLHLRPEQVSGILSILSQHDISLVSLDTCEITPAPAIINFKMKQIAQLLTEIGYPLAKRVVNLLLKKRQVEQVALSETLIMSQESCVTLLEKLKVLGIVHSDSIDDAPHTVLRRHYVVWKLDSLSAINNASSYLLDLIYKLYFQIDAEEKAKKETIEGNIEQRENQIKVLKRTFIVATRDYINIHEL